MEYLQLKEICWRYFKNPDNYFQLASYTLSLIFIVSLLMGNDNWHCTPWQWQIGAFAVFFSWLNFIFILKYIPCTAGPINMFFSICVAFLKLMFLAIPLILTFGIPFYMVFVKVSCLGWKMGNIVTHLINGMKLVAVFWQLCAISVQTTYVWISYKHNRTPRCSYEVSAAGLSWLEHFREFSAISRQKFTAT